MLFLFMVCRNIMKSSILTEQAATRIFSETDWAEDGGWSIKILTSNQ
jgi:hypothetical protein